MHQNDSQGNLVTQMRDGEPHHMLETSPAVDGHVVRRYLGWVEIRFWCDRQQLPGCT